MMTYRTVVLLAILALAKIANGDVMNNCSQCKYTEVTFGDTYSSRSINMIFDIVVPPGGGIRNYTIPEPPCVELDGKQIGLKGTICDNSADTVMLISSFHELNIFRSAKAKCNATIRVQFYCQWPGQVSKLSLKHSCA